MKIARTLIASITAGLLATSAFALTQPEYKAAKDTIEADYKASKEKCNALTDNAKDICVKEAKGHEDVAKAELEAQYKPSTKAAYKARVARADADYAIAKEKCDDLSGNAKDVCVKDAKAAHVTAKENAKVAQAKAKPADTPDAKAAAVAEARKDASAEKNEANYKAAKERCDTMQGDVKSKCVDDAKRIYGQ